MTKSKLPHFERMTADQQLVCINYEEQEVKLLALFQQMAEDAAHSVVKLPATGVNGQPVIAGSNKVMSDIKQVYLECIQAFMRYTTGETRDAIQKWKIDNDIK